jgi:hypothetical protein
MTNSQEFRNLYGEPDLERYIARPGISVTVQYGSDHLPCTLPCCPVVFNKHVLSILIGGVESQTQLRDMVGSRRLNCNSPTTQMGSVTRDRPGIT